MQGMYQEGDSRAIFYRRETSRLRRKRKTKRIKKHHGPTSITRLEVETMKKMKMKKSVRERKVKKERRRQREKEQTTTM